MDTFTQSDLQLVHSTSMRGHVWVQYLAQIGKTEDQTTGLLVGGRPLYLSAIASPSIYLCTVCMYVFISLSIHLSIYLCTVRYACISLSLSLSLDPYIPIPLCMCIYIYIYMYLSIHPSIYISMYSTVSSLSLSLSLSLFPSLHPSIHPLIYMLSLTLPLTHTHARARRTHAPRRTHTNMAASVSPLRSSFRICSPLTLHHPRCRAKLRTHRKCESQRRHVHQTASR